MNPDTVPADIQKMHTEYERLSRAPLTLDWTRLDAWRVFLGFRKPPFTAADLQLVVAHLRVTRKGPVLDGSMKFHNLIQRPDFFEEDLNIAKAVSRPRPPVTKHIVSNDVARIVADDGCGDTAVPIAVVIQKLREAANGLTS